VSEFLSKYSKTDAVNQKNIKTFIEFGLLKKLIYRVHKYVA